MERCVNDLAWLLYRCICNIILTLHGHTKMSNRRNPYSFSDFSLRRLLLQGARAARGSPQLGTRLCDVERGSVKYDKSHPSTSGSSGSNKNNTDSMSQHSAGTLTASIPITSQPRTSVGSPLKNDCPQCSDSMHPSDIQALLQNHQEVIKKYEDFMVRRVLLTDPDSRWCPAPDCSYAVIATGCASCPRIKCERPGCDINFCYHCKAEWHPDQTCDAARASRQSPIRAPSGSISQDSQHRDDIKPCPRCQVLIVKMDDGSCNHMVCAVCGSEFCWLCMKVISDLHYLSPSGCTFWGKKPWSRKKKLLWQLGTLIGAPVGIALVAGIAVPAMIIGIPVWIGRKIHTRYRLAGKHKRNCALLSGVAASVLVSPVLAGLAVAIGVPILLFYVYGVVPVSLCRAGCGVSTTRDGFKFDFDEEEDIGSRHQDASSRIGATSIGEVSLSVASGHLGMSSGQNVSFGGITNSNRESTMALAGSITGLEVQADVSSSETASAVTCVSEKSGNTLHDTASTRALAGSILSYKQQDSSNLSEDGMSERIRYSQGSGQNDSIKDYIWTTLPSDQDYIADKASLSSGKSQRSTDIDTASVSSAQKRAIPLVQRISKLHATQHRNVSVDSSSNVDEPEPDSCSITKTKLSDKLNDKIPMPSCSSGKSDMKNFSFMFSMNTNRKEFYIFGGSLGYFLLILNFFFKFWEVRLLFKQKNDARFLKIKLPLQFEMMSQINFNEMIN
ncbi:E3 ubiquitin-protein ligase RNF19A [Pseudolycoriella hygida]|uniref:RBR-type E3 ubiquitin transferase n=1 Tax=Pseudolycoriella hygida TaxID=35572 RepID=A0A9Q0MU43_9DIPT|nr:E3 ubiquitin-protein ligase RNF19A [Pseudolycoriella hygida]